MVQSICCPRRFVLPFDLNNKIKQFSCDYLSLSDFVPLFLAILKQFSNLENLVYSDQLFWLGEFLKIYSVKNETGAQKKLINK